MQMQDGCQEAIPNYSSQRKGILSSPDADPAQFKLFLSIFNIT